MRTPPGFCSTLLLLPRYWERRRTASAPAREQEHPTNQHESSTEEPGLCNHGSLWISLFKNSLESTS